VPEEEDMPLGRRKSAEDIARQEAEQAVARRREMFHLESGGPEVTARASQQARADGDRQLALRLAVRAVDRLHDLYCFDRFDLRRPSSADAFVIDLALDTLAESRRATPGLNVHEEVKELTHRLRAITTSTEGIRVDPALYRTALGRLAEIAPDVPVDDIYWH
jgi:hypothetical protein